MTTIMKSAPTDRLPVLGGEVDPRVVQDAVRFADRLTELTRVIQFRDRDRACCYDVSVSQCYALRAAIEADGITVNELAAELYLDKSTASRIAAGLVERGYFERERDPEDRRIVRMHATAAGNEIHNRIEEDLISEYAAMLADFQPEVRQAITELVERLGSSFASRVEVSGGNCCVVRE